MDDDNSLCESIYIDVDKIYDKEEYIRYKEEQDRLNEKRIKEYKMRKLQQERRDKIEQGYCSGIPRESFLRLGEYLFNQGKIDNNNL